MHYGYLLRGSLTGLFKVGITSDPRRRYSNFKTHVSERINQEAVKRFISKEEAVDWERLILSWHEDSIEHGEWIAATFEEMAKSWCVGVVPVYDHINKIDFLIVDQAQGLWTSSIVDPVTRVLTCANYDCVEELKRMLIPSFGYQLDAINIPRFVTPEVVKLYQLDEKRWNDRREAKIARMIAERATCKVSE
jgi:predicted GIY-YIG superfamily endonuclease